MSFVHLHTHSDYSLCDGAIRISDAIKRTKELGQNALALTDRCNLFAAVEFYSKAKAEDIKPIIGADLFINAHSETLSLFEGATTPDELQYGGVFQNVILAKTNEGYKSLVKLVSQSYLDPVCDDVPILKIDILHKHAKDLIIFIGHHKSELAFLLKQFKSDQNISLESLDAQKPLENHESFAPIKSYLTTISQTFGVENIFFELCHNGFAWQEDFNRDLAFLARKFGYQCVVTSDAHYIDREDMDAHAILTGVRNDLTMKKLRDRRKDLNFHMQSEEEIHRLFADYPEAIANTQKIADSCDVEFEFGKFFLPNFDLGTGESQDETMERLSKEGLEERFEQLQPLYGEKFDDDAKKVYYDRLDYELSVIRKMGFPGYFLIVQDFINWAKEHDIPVGPGRGSGAGSLVAYSLKITDIDPLPYNLIFERFLNPERVSMPDFDVDFCQSRRDEVIKYVSERYGAENVAQITTFGKMLAKAAIRDVGRVMDMSYTRVDAIAKLIPDELGITLTEALDKEPKLGEAMRQDESVEKLINMALKLEGMNRHTSVHAAGVVISEGGMDNFVPVYKDDQGSLITQFEMKNAEKVGLVKFDFLGLKTLTVIKHAVDLVQKRRDPEFQIESIDLEVKKVYDLISEAKSVGVFQLESTGMQQLLTKLQPSTFEDIIALVALFRPGPLQSGMVDDFVERKHGRQKIEYALPELEPILKDTYGTILYQEQVQKIAAVLASYSLGEADLLRRAMGKKKPEEMAKQKKRFVEGCIKNSIDQKVAEDLFELMAKFAQYGFNKSHSAAYGLVSYQTAYLKTLYTEEFMAAIMSCDMDNTDKIVRYVKDCKDLGLKVLPPDINLSFHEFTVPEDKTICYGLGAIKGVGAQAVEVLVNERNENGPYLNLMDLAKRIDLKKVGKKQIELLIQVGAFDEFGFTRPVLCKAVNDLVRYSEDLHNAKNSGQGMLFGEEDTTQDDERADLGFAMSTDQDLETRLSGGANVWVHKEKSLLGISLSAHLLDLYDEDVRRFSKAELRDLAGLAGTGSIPVVCVLTDYFERFSKSGKKMMVLRFEDKTDEVSPALFENEFPEVLPPKDTVVIALFRPTKSYDPSFPPRIKLDEFIPIEDFRLRKVKEVTLTVANEKDDQGNPKGGEFHQDFLKRLMSKTKGSESEDLIPCRFEISSQEGTVKLNSVSLAVKPDDDFIQFIGDLNPQVKGMRYRL